MPSRRGTRYLDSAREGFYLTLRVALARTEAVAAAAAAVAAAITALWASMG